MGHKYVKEEDTFNTSQNGTVPKPTPQEVTDNKFLRADGAWAAGAGGSVVSADQVVSAGIEIGGITIDGARTAFYAPLHTYSATEQRVGTWVDGKPIYEKTYNNVSVNVGSSTSRHYTDITNVASLNIDKVIRLDGMWIDDTNWKPLSCADNYSFQLVYNTTGSKITALTTNVTGTKSIFYTIQYTKTTDTV